MQTSFFFLKSESELMKLTFHVFILIKTIKKGFDIGIFYKSIYT